MQRIPMSVLINMKVLYVEDEEVTKIIMQKQLRKLVGKLYTAKDGDEGYEYFLKYSPDIIITDIRMPKMNGIDFIHKVKEINEDVGIIVTTEVNEVDDILRTIDAGIHKYLVKPVNMGKLQSGLKEVADKIIRDKISKQQMSALLELDKEQKNEMQLKIKSVYIHFMKEKTGKGPKDIDLFVQGDQIYLKAKESLTMLEKSLIEKRENSKLVEYNRKIFFENYKIELAEKISETVERNIAVQKISTNVIEDMDQLILKILS